MEHILVPAILSAFILFNVVNLAALHTWLERKQSALMQDRIGANRAAIFGLRMLGLFHPIADTIKMFFKEDYVPPRGNRFLHFLAPCVSIFFALVAFAAIPFGDTLTIFGRTLHLQVANLNAALLYIFAMMSMGVYGVVLAGFSSNSNYAFLGSLRAVSQMLSYEIALGLSIMGCVMVYGTLDLQQMVHAQGKFLFDWIPLWGIVVQPVGFFLFLAAGLAETKRIPYDVPEGESEIVGYFVEYSGMKFGMFFFTDYLETIMIACLTTTLFLGGWQVPWLGAGGFYFPCGTVWSLPPLAVSLLQMGSFALKVLFLCWLFMTVRWTLPRFRYDQLLRLGWKMIFPMAVINLLVTGVILLMVRT